MKIKLKESQMQINTKDNALSEIKDEKGKHLFERNELENKKNARESNRRQVKKIKQIFIDQNPKKNKSIKQNNTQN